MGTHMRHLAAIVLGNLLVAFAVTAFIVPHGLVLGGSTGISLVATHFVPLQLSLAVLIVNGLLFVVGSFFLGKPLPPRPS